MTYSKRYSIFPVDNCWIKLVLDKRTNKVTEEYPMAICFMKIDVDKNQAIANVVA